MADVSSAKAAQLLPELCLMPEWMRCKLTESGAVSGVVIGGWIDAHPGEPEVTIDGRFTPQQLREIAEFMEKKQDASSSV